MALLTLDQLAERWAIDRDKLKRRLRRLKLPAVNLGTEHRPELRFNLATVEAWERSNEDALDNDEKEPTAVPAGLGSATDPLSADYKAPRRQPQ